MGNNQIKTVGRIDLPLPLVKSGKVRDIFSLNGDLLIVASDRLSAFDYVLPSLIPCKGQVLNRLAAFWFKRTADFIPNHVRCDEPEKLTALLPFASLLSKRALLAKKMIPFPIEAIVRGYLSGSGWQTYKKSGEISGIPLPSGLTFAAKLPEPIFTPTTKAAQGHDEDLTYAQVVERIGAENAAVIRRYALGLYQRVSQYAQTRGIIIADSKFEFGRDEEGRIILIDEIFTPDSSRFWKAADYRPGIEPPPFDKQLVRNYLLHSTWDRHSPPPELPAEIIARTSAAYLEIFRILTGEEL